MKTDFFYNNAKRLLHESGCDAVILSGNKIMLRNGDNVYKFRQNSSFWYYSGVSEPNCTLVITKNEYFVVMPQFERGEMIMDGKTDDYRPSSPNQKIKFYSHRVGSARLSKIILSAKKVGMIVPSNRRDPHHQANEGGRKLYQRIKRSYPTKNITDISQIIIKQRAIKQPFELDKIKSACSITMNAFNKIRSQINQYEHEYQIEADFSQMFRRGGAENAYPVIVASGDNASQIHNFLNRSKLSKNSLVVIDAGAEVENYAADVTRTYFLGAKPSQLVLDLYQATASLKQFAEKLVSPGVSWRDYEIAVEEKAGELLKNLGLIKTLDRNSIREFYPHATSHLLGLDVHDVGDYRSPMQRNMVITIEPGFYSKSHGFGMRIEDDYLITENGVVNLTGDLSSELR